MKWSPPIQGNLGKALKIVCRSPKPKIAGKGKPEKKKKNASSGLGLRKTIESLRFGSKSLVRIESNMMEKEGNGGKRATQHG